MARNSKIEWTDHTFNPWWGCTKVSPACDHCYAEAWAKRVGFDVWSAGRPRRYLSDGYWQQPYRWEQEAVRAGRRFRVFCASMADVFEWKRGLADWRKRLWATIESTPNLDWLLLTKRPHLVERLTPWNDDWPANVWLGTTVESQKWVNKRLPHIEESGARIRFLSCEPLLGEIHVGKWLERKAIHWVIAGGESGPKARPSDPEWFYSLRDQCVANKTPFHFKQWGDWAPTDAVQHALPRSVINSDFYSTQMGRFGKKSSGRYLKGRIWDDIPERSVEPYRNAFVTREPPSPERTINGNATLTFEGP